MHIHNHTHACWNLPRIEAQMELAQTCDQCSGHEIDFCGVPARAIPPKSATVYEALSRRFLLKRVPGSTLHVRGGRMVSRGAELRGWGGVGLCCVEVFGTRTGGSVGSKFAMGCWESVYSIVGLVMGFSRPSVLFNTPLPHPCTFT